MYYMKIFTFLSCLLLEQTKNKNEKIIRKCLAIDFDKTKILSCYQIMKMLRYFEKLRE